MKQYLLFLLISATLFGCSDSQKKGQPTRGYGGGFGEVVVVAKEVDWNNGLKVAVDTTISAPQYGLPQPEPAFSVIFIKERSFSDIFKPYRNIVQIIVDEDSIKYRKDFEMLRNVWAKGQIVFRLRASSREEAAILLVENSETIKRIFRAEENNRHFRRNKKFGNAELIKKQKDSNYFYLTPRKDMRLARNEKGATWLRLEREIPKGGYKHPIEQSVLTFTRPYESKEQFLDTNIILTLRQALHRHIPGPTEGSYMEISYKMYQPRFKEINFRDAYSKEIRGLWRVKNGFMGGPFYALVTLNEEHQEIVYSFGYVFAPQFDKREYLRTMEGVVLSLNYTTEEK